MRASMLAAPLLAASVLTGCTGFSFTISVGGGGSTLISTQGIGPFTADGTLGGFIDTLPDTDGAYIANYMVDYSAYCFFDEGQEVACALVFFRPVLERSDRIVALVTSNPAFQTQSGIGPGTLIADAEAQWGQVTLSFSFSDEQREYLSFAGGPGFPIYMRSEPPPGFGFAGVYPPTIGDYHQTQTYRVGSRIGRFGVLAQ